MHFHFHDDKKKPSPEPKVAAKKDSKELPGRAKNIDAYSKSGTHNGAVNTLCGLFCKPENEK